MIFEALLSFFYFIKMMVAALMWLLQVYYENIMYSGHLMQMGALFEAFSNNYTYTEKVLQDLWLICMRACLRHVGEYLLAY